MWCVSSLFGLFKFLERVELFVVSVSARGVVEGRDTLFAIMTGSCERPLSADLPLSLLPGIVPAIKEGGINLSLFTS